MTVPRPAAVAARQLLPIDLFLWIDEIGLPERLVCITKDFVLIVYSGECDRALNHVQEVKSRALL